MTEYGYNEDTNVLEWVRYPNDTQDTRTEYEYDARYRMVFAGTQTDSRLQFYAGYTYGTNDLLTELVTRSTVYNIQYGLFDQTGSVRVGNRDLATYTYTNNRDRRLQQLQQVSLLHMPQQPKRQWLLILR